MLAGLVCSWLGVLDCKLVVMYANTWVPTSIGWLFSARVRTYIGRSSMCTPLRIQAYIENCSAKDGVLS